MNINSDIKLPFYSEVVKINNDELFLLRGKFDDQESNIDEFYNFSLKDNSIKKLKMFNYLIMMNLMGVYLLYLVRINMVNCHQYIMLFLYCWYK